MSNRKIKWESSKKRIPILSFFMSVITPGLGIIYNGSLVKGSFLLFFLFFALLFPVAYSFLHDNLHLIFAYVFFVIFAFILYIYSILYSTLSSYKNKEFYPKSYNNFLFYFVYFIFSSILFVTALTLNLYFFSIKRVNNSSMYPLIEKGDIVLLYRVSEAKLKIGEIVLYESNGLERLSRLVEMRSDFLIEYKKTDIYINNVKLKRTIYTVDEIVKNNLPNEEYLYIEKNYNSKYPVLLKKEDMLSEISYKYKLKKGEVFLMPDNRSMRLPAAISQNFVKHKVIGIIFSSNLKKVFTDF